MKNKIEKDYRIPLSLSDNTSRLSYTGFFTAFVDFASEHAADLGMGKPEMGPKGLIWITSKTKICVYDRPQMLSTVQLTTWPGPADKSRSNRYYTMHQDGRLLAEAKNEWAVLEPATGRMHRVSEVFPKGLEICMDTACDVPYYKVSDDFSTAETLGIYTVTFSDLDTSNHMNNAAYVRRIFSAFDSKKIAELPLKEMEVAYKHQCYEGEQLTLKIRHNDTGFDVGVIKDDGRTAATMRFICK